MFHPFHLCICLTCRIYKSESWRFERLLWSECMLDDFKEALLAKEWNFLHLWKDETNLPLPQGFSQIRIWIILETTIDTTTTQNPLLLSAPQAVDLQLKPDDDHLCLSPNTINYATSALMMQLKTMQTLCWKWLLYQR